MSLRYTRARAAAWFRVKWRRAPGLSARRGAPGISIVIPSRNGRGLLETGLPTVAAQAFHLPIEILVVDNGSDDGTAAWLAGAYPEARLIGSPTPLSFARAVNRGIARASYSHVCLLNNDMLIEPGFFTALWRAFEKVPDLFCATAQIRFPAGVRREETGKAVMAQGAPDDFPVHCEEPLEGEDLTWVLYGSGGCSLYDAARLSALGNVDEAYEPAYVEDLDLGWRAWQQGWPTVYVAGALVEHRHRATTSRYYSPAELDRVLEINYLKFLARAVDSPPLFRKLWNESLERLRRTGRLPAAAGIAMRGGWRTEIRLPEEAFLALTDGSVAVFPGRGPAAAGVLMLAIDRLAPPDHPLDRYAEIVVVRGAEEGLAFRTACDLTARKWPGVTLWAAAAGEPARPLRTT